MVVRIRARQVQRNLRYRPDPSTTLHRTSHSHFLVPRESTGECSFRLSNRASVPYGAFSWQLGHESALDERNHSSRQALQNTCLFAHNVTTGDSAKSAHIL